MTAFVRPARIGVLAALLAGTAFAAWSQAPADGADTSRSSVAAAALPGTVVERNVFVPVDSTGHTGGEYIVVERRVVTKGGDKDSATSEVPTHFILVPQESDDEETEPGESNGDDDSR